MNAFLRSKSELVDDRGQSVESSEIDDAARLRTIQGRIGHPFANGRRRRLRRIHHVNEVERCEPCAN